MALSSAEPAVAATILVVDDDPDIQELLQIIINSAGYEVATASSGEEALAFLRQGRQVSLVLLDLMMPVMNGYQFLAELGKDPAHACTPVVAVTGAGPSALAALPASVPILQKPFGDAELLSTVERYKKQAGT
jgi:CheY-like chemotaxis protein